MGQEIRAHRKALGVNATAAAEAAGMSRVTLHRIEKGEPSVTIGAYMNAAAALGLEFGVVKPVVDLKGLIPARIRMADYPQLRKLAWQVHGTDELTPLEALGIYEQNWRHADIEAMDSRERDLVDALRQGLGTVNEKI
jgi:transcriptional regulator with XRE-family HTH domain